jgi:hypothetical protein
MAKVLIVAFSNLAKDPRVIRHISALKNEHEIVTIGYGEAPDFVSSHYQLPSSSSYLPLSIKGVASLLLRRFDYAYQSTSAVKNAAAHIDALSFDAALFNDVQTLGLIEHLNRDCPAMIDMHEYAPREMEDDWRFRVLLQRYYTYLCANYLPEFEAVTSVSPGLAREYSSSFGVNCQILLNAREHMSLSVNQPSDETIKIVHSGLATKHRHIERMIQACEGIPNVTLDLYLMPAPRQKRTYKKLCNLAAATSNCKVIAPIPMDDLPSTMNKYDVGLAFIAPSSFSLEYSLGNKFFDYIQARLSIVTGPSPDMAKYVAELNNGDITQGFSAEDLRKTILEMTPEKLSAQKNNSNFAATLLNSEIEAEKLKLIVNEMISS